ncbi:MAG TPA: hypothetical protein VM617_06195 [Thermoanaerobaculia bacterium]|nr:hypothetical protein [Thermoanaerobaculia bacterium]
MSPTPVLRIAVVVSLVAATPSIVRAQSTAAVPDTPRWQAGLEVQGLYFDNFFQLSDDEEQEDVEALRVAGRLAWRPWDDRPLELYGVGGVTAYGDDALDQTLLLGTGLVWDGASDDFSAGVRLELDRPSFEVGDTFGTADLAALDAVYSHRPTRDWELSGNAELSRLDYAEGRGRDNDFVGVGGAVRYRGWGYDLSPELGVDVGRRDAVDADEDQEQTDVWLKLRSAPLPPLYLSLRFRHRVRDYPTDDPGSGNFGREDDRQQVALTADWKASDLATWILYYAWEDADSTNPSRVFTTQTLAVGARLTF